MEILPKRSITILLIILIIALPLFIITAWGAHFADEVYSLLRFARNLAWASGTSEIATGSLSMLFSLPVAAFARLGVEPALAAAVLSALGWSATAFAFLTIGKRVDRTAGSAVAALLLCFSPIIIISLGNPISWTVALSWWTAAFLLGRRVVLALASIALLILFILPFPVALPVLQPTLAAAFGWSLLLFLAGIGAQDLGEWLAAHRNSPLPKEQLINASLLAIFLLIAGYQIISFSQLFRTKPESQWALEDEIARWILTNTPGNALIGTGEKIGYLANRQILPAQQIIARSTTDDILDLLQEHPLDYLVSNDTLPWQLLAKSRWFQLNYQAVVEFSGPDVAQAPYTIWRYQAPPPDLGYAHALNARVPDRLRILGYQVNQEMLESANEAVITLYLQTPANTIEPVTEFSATIRFLSPGDLSTLAEWDAVLPGSVNVQNWQPGQQISEQIVIDLPPDLEAGAYPLNISLTGPDSPEYWPISMDNDLKRLDRIQLGHVIVPAEYDQNAIQSREAQFAGSIMLLGFTSPDPQPGEALELTLFWQTSEPIEENYIVFAHLLDSNGQLVANHDSIPDNGRFPIPSWLPEMTISDSHVIQLPTKLPSGEYQVRVGMYAPETGDRLPLIAADGSSPPDNSFPLTQLSIP